MLVVLAMLVLCLRVTNNFLTGNDVEASELAVASAQLQTVLGPHKEVDLQQPEQRPAEAKDLGGVARDSFLITCRRAHAVLRSVHASHDLYASA